jgi:hypothetical protein
MLGVAGPLGTTTLRHALGLHATEIDDRAPETIKATVLPGLEDGTAVLWFCDACDFWALPDDLRAVARHAVANLVPE